MKKPLIQDLTPLLLAVAVVVAAAIGMEAAQGTATGVGLETLRGTVLSDEPAPKPLARAHVSVEWDGGRSDPVSTDDQGRFETRVPTSRPSVVTVTKVGFVPWEGRRARSATDRPIEVRLARGAVVTGTVVDRTGAPVAGLTVNVRRAPSPSGGAATTPDRQADTDDRGEFRVGGLPAGRYELVLSPFSDIQLVTPTNGGATKMRLNFKGSGGQTTSVAQLRAGEETTVHLVQEEPAGNTPVALAKLAEMKREVEGARAANSRPRASIQGRITDVNGRPVAGALVRALSDDGGSLVVDSDDEGRYAVAGLMAGAVQIVASKSGFVQTAYGSAAADRTGRKITVADGQRITGADVSLQRGSVISGTVVDQSGDPAEGVAVELWQSRFKDGHEMVSRVTDVASSKTDDRGHYRLFALQPGVYYVGVIRGERGASFSGEVSIDGDDVNIKASMVHVDMGGVVGAPVFYPGRLRIAEALQVPLEVGQDAFGVDVGLVGTRLARVRGEVIDGSGQPFRGTVSLAVSGRSGAPILESRTVSVANGSFEFADVAPGDYVVQARADGFVLLIDSGTSLEPVGPASGDDRALSESVAVILSDKAPVEAGGAGKGVRVAGSIESQPQFGMAFVTVGDGDALAAPVFIQTSPGSSMTGRLVLEGAAEATVSGLTLRATPVDLDYAPRDGKPASTSIAVGRDFELTGLTGPLRFDLDGRLPDGWWLKSVTIDGVNAADEPVTFGASSQSRRGVEVVLSNHAAEVSGQVAGAATQGSGASIVVFPTAPERWFERSRYVKVARADRNGRFTIGGLPPGEYWVAAADAGFVSSDSGASPSPDVLTALAASARRVTLREGGRVSVEVRKRP